MKTNRILKPVLILLTLCISHPGFARSPFGFHQLSVSGGVASPSTTLAAFENPAGLIYTTRPTIMLGSDFQSDSLSNPLLEGGLYLGNGGMGLGVGILKPTTTAGTSSAFFGAGAYLTGLRTAFGFNGGTTLSSGGSSWFNVGMLIGPYDQLRFGLASMDVTNSARQFQGGVNYDVSPQVALVVDSAVESGFTNPWLQPGLHFHSDQFSVTGSYGFQLNTRTWTPTNFTDGFSAGLGFRLASKVGFRAYYKHVPKYYGEFTFEL